MSERTWGFNSPLAHQQSHPFGRLSDVPAPGTQDVCSSAATSPRPSEQATTSTSTRRTSRSGTEEDGGGPSGRGRLAEAVGGRDGRTSIGADAAQAQPGRRVRLPGVRVAGPRSRPPQARRVLRERRQGGRRGGDHRPAGAGVLRRAQPRRAEGRTPTTGWASRAGCCTRWCAGATPRTTSRSPGTTRSRSSAETLNGPRRPGPGDLLHLRQDVERGGVRLPAVRPRLRHQQPARLLEHVPRVHVGRRWPRRSGSARARCRLEDVHTADLIVISGQNPGTNHPRMLTALEIAKENGARILSINPLPEAGLMQLPEPADGPRPDRRRHRPVRPAPADPHQRRPRAVAGVRRAAARARSASTATSSTRHDRVRGVRRPRAGRGLGRGRARDRARPRR